MLFEVCCFPLSFPFRLFDCPSVDSNRPALRDVTFASIELKSNCTVAVTTINSGNVTLGPSSFCVFTNDTSLGCNTRRMFPGEKFVVSLSVESYPLNANLNFTVKSTFGDDCNSEIMEHAMTYHYDYCIPSVSTSPTASTSESSTPSTSLSQSPTNILSQSQPVKKSSTPPSSNSKSLVRTPSTSIRKRSICVNCEVL